MPDSTRRFGVLELAIVAQNAFNYDEKVTVGYDIYSPQGKLLDFNMREVSIPGRSVDTVRFSPFIYGSYDNEWKAGGKTPPLYKVMLFTRRDGVYKEYMPLRIGFGRTELEEGRPMRLGRELQLVRASYNAAVDPETTLAELKALKAQGKNTVCPDFPQPAWFYDLCDRTGLYVIDRAAIDAPERRDDRRVGGTPWPTSTSSGSGPCTTVRATSPAWWPTTWAAPRATDTICIRPTNGSGRSNRRVR